MYKKTKAIILILILSLSLSTVIAQASQELTPSKSKSKDMPISMSFSFKTSHLWRGLDCSPSPYFATDLHLSDKNEIIKIGLWNGLGSNGIFKELNHYVSISKSNFTLELWDVYNFSTNANYNNKEYFNYRAKETGRFLDVSLKYRFSDKFPIQIMWATIPFGRDRGVLNEHNRYSSYLELEYPVYRSGMINLDLGVGGAFALKRGRNEMGKKVNAHFWGNDAGITNIYLQASKDISFCNYKIPVAIYGMWNPEGNRANIQVALTLFSM